MRPLRHKFNAVRTERDGIKFASKREAAQYDKLMVLQKSAQVVFFLRQVPFHLPGGVKYVADFLVFFADGHCEIQDAKGMKTQLYIAKKKMVESVYPITITEV